MSLRRTRAATAEQSAASRSKGQKVNNASQDVANSTQKTRQKRKSIAAKQTSKKESPDILEVTIKKKATKKKTFRRRLNLDEGAETEGTPVVQENQNVDQSLRMLRDMRCDNIAKVELVRTSLAEVHASRDLNSKKVPNRKLQQKTSTTKLSPLVVTPKSTPPKLSLTPHRSKKTPKKSPIALGSPKTHSLAVSKLLKSPRKLSLAAAADDSDTDRKTSTSPTVKTKRKKSDKNLKAMVRKFSKSPKIVLKSPKSKSKLKSKSRKLKLSPSPRKGSMLEMSPSTSPSTPNLSKSSRIDAKESPSPKRKNLSPIKRRLLNSKAIKTLTPSQVKDVLAEPVVLLEKLSESMKGKYTVMSPSKTQSNTLLTVPKLPSISAKRRSDSKVLTPVKRASPGVSPKRNSSTKLKNSSTKKSRVSNTSKISPRIKYNTSIEKDRSSVPLMSSTPQEEKMDISLPFNTSIASLNNTSPNARLRHRNRSSVQLSSSIIDKNTDIENVSRPSLFDKEISNTSQSRLSGVAKQDTTYEEKLDNTFELDQPQTSNLRQMLKKKRTSTDADLSLKDAFKKAKVRFADLTSHSDSVQKSINKLNGSRSSVSHNVQLRNNVISSIHKSKKETPKFTPNSLISSFKRPSPRLRGDTPQARLSRIQVTPKTFATEKKSEKKSSMKKKVPNFGRIHEQIFAKSESLMDAKKRLEARHQAFTVNKTISKVDRKTEGKKLLPTDTKDGVHNRFGFKLKKPEATHIVLRKQTVFSREKQQHETRMMLQGVRTNRRFELQMKARNLNP